MHRSRNRLIAAAAAVAVAAPLAGCGSDSSDEATAGGSPPAASFPEPGGATLEAFLSDFPAGELVVSPAGRVFTPGRNRFGFGVFTVDRSEIDDAQVAIYAAPGPDGRARGPFPARIESLETDPAFRAQTSAGDSDATVVYVSELRLDRPGEWRLVALAYEDGELAATRLPSVEVAAEDRVPAPGERAPRVHTPTAAEVGDIAEIDTRVPPSTMHEHDLAEVLGSEPVVLVFATPALCQSRVCGPVVDIAEQVKRDHEDDAAFIYSEIYRENDPNQPLRPPVQAFGLPSEPWVFVIDRQGRIDSRIEGAFSAAELEAAVERVVD